jgi:hypothetical protein
MIKNYVFKHNLYIINYPRVDAFTNLQIFNLNQNIPNIPKTTRPTADTIIADTVNVFDEDSSSFGLYDLEFS